MRLAIIGGGAAGMMAAVFAAKKGIAVDLYERNEKLGKKLYITGKGRCNLTNACDMEELLGSVRSNPKFLYSAFYGFTNRDAMDFFEPRKRFRYYFNGYNDAPSRRLFRS